MKSFLWFDLHTFNMLDLKFLMSPFSFMLLSKSSSVFPHFLICYFSRKKIHGFYEKLKF